MIIFIAPTSKTMKGKIKYLIALSQLKGVGFRRAHQILEQFGTARSFIEACLSFPEKIPSIIRDNCTRSAIDDALAYAEKQIDYCDKYKVEVLAYDDERYPYRLRRYADCPLILYARGHMDLNAMRTVGVVGTRKMTTYGKWMVEDLIRDLKGYDVLVVSGLAYGVDTEAHRNCVLHSVPTVGVMGTGIDMIYPASNRDLAKKMLNRGGVITEFGIDTKPDAFNFPARNRIIAGMSDALVVVESKDKGGAMITADLAFGYDKEVFAFPGKATDSYSRGTNMLIKSQKAQLIESASDLLNHMSWDEVNTQEVHQPTLFDDLSDQEKSLLESFGKNQIFHIDQVLARLPYSNSETASILLQMELKGILKSLPGSRYKII